jgi:uncharacterized membrane protein YqiK
MNLTDMTAASILFVAIAGALMVIMVVAWIAIVITDYIKNMPEETPEIEIWSSVNDSLGK